MNKLTIFDLRWLGASIPRSHWHFHQQLFRRYQMVLGPGEYSEMVRDIRSGIAVLIEKRKGRTAIYSVKIHAQYERIFVLSDGRQVLTAWPPEKRLNDIRRALVRALDPGPTD